MLRDLQQATNVEVVDILLAIFSMWGGNNIELRGDEASPIMLLLTPK